MKSFLIFFFSLSPLFPGLPTQAQELSPSNRVYRQFLVLKGLPAEIRPDNATETLIKNIAALDSKDHNYFLFKVLELYYNDFSIENRSLIVDVLTKLQKHLNLSNADIKPASNWYHVGNGLTAAFGASVLYVLLKGRGVKIPSTMTAQQAVRAETALNGPLSKFSNKLSEAYLKHLTFASASFSSSAGVGVLFLIDSEFREFIFSPLKSTHPDDFPLIEYLFQYKVPPLELMYLLDVAIVCDMHTRLVELSKFDLNSNDKLARALSTHSKAEVEEFILPNLTSLEMVSNSKENIFMREGFEPKKDEKIKAYIEDAETKSNTKDNLISQKTLMCDQVNLGTSKRFANDLLFQLQKLSDNQ